MISRNFKSPTQNRQAATRSHHRRVTTRTDASRDRVKPHERNTLVEVAAAAVTDSQAHNIREQHQDRKVTNSRQTVDAGQRNLHVVICYVHLSLKRRLLRNTFMYNLPSSWDFCGHQEPICNAKFLRCDNFRHRKYISIFDLRV